MGISKTESARRQDRAQDALDGLGPARSESEALSLQCRASHHLATVHRTDAGLVYVARTGPHSHGDRDFIDTGSHGSRGGTEFVDLVVAPGADDTLPAWCDCGASSISRQEIVDLVREGRRTAHLP